MDASVFSGQVGNGTAPIEVGRRYDGYWPGSIDEVAIYSTALSADQVQAHLAAAR
jgi:hypothetical protein